MSTFGELLYPIYYTAAVDGNSMDGQVSHQVVRSNSLRQVMRSAAPSTPSRRKPRSASIGTMVATRSWSRSDRLPSATGVIWTRRQ
jgi:hypothetical protein